MLENKRIESDVIRLGAEQEFCLVDQSWRSAPKAAAILKSLKDKHFTTELAKYNVDINLDPFEVKTSVFKKLKTQLHNLVDKVHQIAATHNSKVILSGIHIGNRGTSQRTCIELFKRIRLCFLWL